MSTVKPGTPAGGLGAPVRAAPHQHLLVLLTGVGQAPALSLAVTVAPLLPMWEGLSARVGLLGTGWVPVRAHLLPRSPAAGCFCAYGFDMTSSPPFAGLFLDLTCPSAGPTPSTDFK